MKELEALELLNNRADWYCSEAPVDYDECNVKSKEAFETLEKALTPPTSEEVCEELERYLPHKVTYDSERWAFNSYADFGTPFNICQCHENTNISWNTTVKFRLKTILLICRFYQGVKE